MEVHGNDEEMEHPDYNRDFMGFKTIEEVSPEILLKTLISVLRIGGGIENADLIKFFVVNALTDQADNEKAFSILAQTLGKTPENCMKILSQINWGLAFKVVPNMQKEDWELFKVSPAIHGRGVELSKKSLLIQAGAVFFNDGTFATIRVKIEGHEYEGKGVSEAVAIVDLERKCPEITRIYANTKVEDIEKAEAASTKGLFLFANSLKMFPVPKKIKASVVEDGQRKEVMMGWRMSWQSLSVECTNEAKPDMAKKKALIDLIIKRNPNLTVDDVIKTANKMHEVAMTRK